MLSSHIAAMPQSSIAHALLQSSAASSTAMLRSTGTLPRRCRPRHQIRTLRIGLWSSYLDPELRKEVQRHHRIMKHKYMEAANRKSPWERYTVTSSRPFEIKGFMCSAWRGQDPRPGRWVDVDHLDESITGQQTKSRGIEDVEQSAFDKLFDSKDGIYDKVREKSRIWFMSANNAINPIISSAKVAKDTPRRTAYGLEDFQRRFERFQNQRTPKPDHDYEIDPITNRKVFKNKTSEIARKPIEVPVKTFKGYRSQFHDFNPPTSQSTESAKPCPVEEGFEGYDKSADRGPVLYKEPGAKLPEKHDFVRETLKEYEKKNPIGAVRYREPDGKLPEEPDSVRESLKEYEKTHPVGAVRYREPDGKLPEQPCPVQEGLKDYDSRVTYGPVLYNEPDGQPPPKRDVVAEGLRVYDERAVYNNGARRILKNISLGNGNHKTNKSFRYPSDDTREDLDLLRPSDVRAGSGIIKGAKKETLAEKLTVRQRLEDDFQKQQDLHNSISEELSTTSIMKRKLDPEARNKLVEKLKVENSELRNIDAHLRGRVNAELANVSAELSSKTSERKITGNFVRDFPEEFEVKWTVAQDSETLKPENEVNSEYVEPAHSSLYSRNSNTPRIQTSLDRTTGSVKAEIVDEARLQNERDPYSKIPQGLETSYADERAEEAKLQNERDPYSKIPQGLETSYANEKAEKAKLQNERDPYSKKPMGLETSYADEVAEKRALELERDPYSKIPQGLETSYIEEVKLQNEKDPYSKKPMGLETSYADEVAARQAEGDLSMDVSSFGKRNYAEKDERARQLLRQEKKNRFKQMDKELIREIRTIYEDKYGVLDSKHRQNPESVAISEPANHDNQLEAKPGTQHPMVYKILAYDPTMQEINTAETTSIVPDSATALTPAEVLLRLSNPAKFFPHFQPLQAEGYEIISGSGDVLVFRKVRQAGSHGSKNESATSIQNRKTTNPIDGMQSSPVVATGNFASPTGFVNHDLPVAEPAFKSNIDVRREEPVFSGKSNWQEESGSTRRKTKGRGKRLLIGAAWVAGCSYAIGVVAEFFRTGGMDGRGPQGF
ncbi:hypothetical protein D0Z07_4465 [Hyphodiscus hymeniophilus]|uniref:Uncharacterized protein n=1 Tax=Hyphodiscus hymeniophilus TaxID=353542 RepID=A0A9P7AXU9_9HELO|nr:hypothetical protein D0Z07_4465 [Hyphodiscus hymeniophilus]